MEMKGKWQKKTALPTIDQIETERKRYRWQKAYFKALRGTISVLTYMAAVAALCFLITAIDTMNILHVGLALADVLLACINFVLHFRNKK